MRTFEFHYVYLAVIFSTIFASVAMGGTPSTTAFTYQGQLNKTVFRSPTRATSRLVYGTAITIPIQARRLEARCR